jgi:sucrose-6-phosphate hydrolase SacC (GH32 family)
MPFNQQMTVPVELTLWKFAEGFRLRANPVKEIAEIAGKKTDTTFDVLKPGKPVLVGEGGTFDMTVSFQVNKATAVGVNIRGIPLTYDAKKKQLTCRGFSAPLQLPAKGEVSLRILVDRGSIEVFADKGQTALSIAAIPPDKNRKAELFSQGGEATAKVQFALLRSAWK